MSEEAERVARQMVNDTIVSEARERRWRYAFTCKAALTAVFGILALVSAALHLDLGVTFTMIGLAGFGMGTTMATGWKT